MTAFEQIELPDGRRGFRKFLNRAGNDSLAAEAAGLAALAATGAVRTPEVIRVSDSELVTEWVGGGSASSPAWEKLGEALATMHSLPQSDFGFETDNYCGATRQPNNRDSSGWRFFTERRLLYQGRMAFEAGLLEPADLQRLESLCAQLEQLVPEQAPALLHGDLWSGNVVFDRHGDAYLIDPAVYRGWPEADLAMTTLFGEFDRAFYEAYEGSRSIEPGWRERSPLYNLYHLINHLNIFGDSYRSSVVSVLNRYA
jgi:fructosamine-3-kinase